jgi:hypothetical protein
MALPIVVVMFVAVVVIVMLSETGLAEQMGTSIADGLGVSSLLGITIVIVIVAASSPRPPATRQAPRSWC